MSHGPGCWPEPQGWDIKASGLILSLMKERLPRAKTSSPSSLRPPSPSRGPTGTCPGEGSCSPPRVSPAEMLHGKGNATLGSLRGCDDQGIATQCQVREQTAHAMPPGAGHLAAPESWRGGRQSRHIWPRSLNSWRSPFPTGSGPCCTQT